MLEGEGGGEAVSWSIGGLQTCMYGCVNILKGGQSVVKVELYREWRS